MQQPSFILIFAGLVLGSGGPPALAQSKYDNLVQEGRARLQSGDSEAALRDGQQAIKQRPTDREGYVLAGGALLNLTPLRRTRDHGAVASCADRAENTWSGIGLNPDTDNNLVELINEPWNLNP